MVARTPARPTGENKPPRYLLKWLNRPAFWALLGSLVLAALYGRVALLNLNIGVVGGDLDGYENLWNDYWVKTGLLDLHRNPFFYTDYLYYPLGISLRYHTLNPLNGLLALPLWPLLGPVASTNFKFVMAMALTTFCAYLLLKDLTGHALAAFAGAAFFTYANDQLWGFYSFGQAEKLSAWWFPLYLFFMFRTLNRPRWYGYAAGGILALLAMCLTDWQYVLYAVLVTLGYFVFCLLTDRTWAEKRAVFIKLAVIGGGWSLLVIFPFILPMIKEAAENPWLTVSEQATFRSRAITQFIDLFPRKDGPTGAYLPPDNPGYLALLIGLAGLWLLWRRPAPPAERRMVIFWSLTALLACVMTLGPRLRWLPDPQLPPTDIPLPYALVQKLPVLSVGRDPERFYIIALVGFAYIFALGLRELIPLINDRVAGLMQRPGRWRPVSFSLVALALGVTLGGFMVKAGEARVDPPDWPQFYYTLAQDPADYAIMELPLFTEKGRGEDTYEAFQVIHGKPRLGGRYARDHKLTNPANFVKRSTLYRDFLWLNRRDQIEKYRTAKSSDFLATPDYAEWGLPLLNYYKVRYIILYPQALRETTPGNPDEAFKAATELVKNILGQAVQPVYADPLLIAYRVPDAPPPARNLLLDTGSNGWYTAEMTGETPHRWANSCNNFQAEAQRDVRLCQNTAAELNIFNLGQQWRQTRVKFTLLAFKLPRTVNVLLDGYQVGTYRLQGDDSRAVELEISLPPSLKTPSLLTFSSPEPLTPTGSPTDRRFLGFGLTQVSAE